MDLPNALLKSFRTSQQPYLYCGKTNRIFRLSPAMSEIIPLYGRYSKEDLLQQLSGAYSPDLLEEGYSIIDNLAQAYGFFSPGALQRRLNSTTQADSEHLLHNGARSMTLEVTESCNLRCRYCTFSGGYSGNRAHGSRPMSWEVAKAAIDFFHGRSKDSVEDRPSIGFYGGEPLLRFDLIQQCVQYAETLPWAHPEGVYWNITTNGTLLNESIARFLIDHKFGVTFSLDGPASEHDRNRTYADGRPTFQRVLTSVQIFYNLAPRDYYDNQVLINCVIAPDTDLLTLNDFFVEQHAWFPRVIASPVRPGHTTFFTERVSRNGDQAAQRDKLFRDYIEAHLQPEPVDPRASELVFVRSLFEKDFVTIHKREIENRVRDEVAISPACFPGQRKILVDTQGSLFVCERVDRSYPIGTVRSGFDAERITALVNEYAGMMNADDCLNCWAFRFCSLCYSSLLKEGRLSPHVKNTECNNIRASAAFTLKVYCDILEQNPAAFDYMDSYVIK